MYPLEEESWKRSELNYLISKFLNVTTNVCLVQLPGLPNPLLVGELFRQYSRPWGELARLHIRNVWEATNTFLELLLRHLADNDACENILRIWLNPIMERKLNAAYAKLDELLEVHKDYPMTTNSQFINNSKRSRQNQRKKEFERTINEAQKSGRNLTAKDISNLFSTTHIEVDSDMDMIAAEESFDNMNAYYEVWYYRLVLSSSSKLTFSPGCDEFIHG